MRGMRREEEGKFNSGEGLVLGMGGGGDMMEDWKVLIVQE